MKKLLAGVLVFCMIVSMLFVAAYAASEEKIYTDRYGDWTYVENDDGNTVAIMDYSGNVADVVIPRTIEGMRVTSINGALFKNNKAVRNVYILFDVRLSDSFFEGCEDITFYAMANSQTAQSLMEHLGDAFAVRVITPNPDVAAAAAAATAAAEKTEEGIKATTYEDENSTGKYVNCTPENVYKPGHKNTTTAFGTITNNEETDEFFIGVHTFDDNGIETAGAGFGTTYSKDGDGALEFVFSAAGSAKDYTNIQYGFGADGKVSNYSYTNTKDGVVSSTEYNKDSNTNDVKYQIVTQENENTTIGTYTKGSYGVTYYEGGDDVRIRKAIMKNDTRKTIENVDKNGNGYDWSWGYDTDTNSGETYVSFFNVTEFKSDGNSIKCASATVALKVPYADASKVYDFADSSFPVFSSDEDFADFLQDYCVEYISGDVYVSSRNGSPENLPAVKTDFIDMLTGSTAEDSDQKAKFDESAELEAKVADIEKVIATTPDEALNECSNNFASAADIIPDFDSYVEAVTPDVSDSNSGDSGSTGNTDNSGANASGSTSDADFSGGANASGTTGDAGFSGGAITDITFDID